MPTRGIVGLLLVGGAVVAAISGAVTGAVAGAMMILGVILIMAGLITNRSIWRIYVEYEKKIPNRHLRSYYS